uniref:3-oxoacyl-[acyl-carrier-protein] reductase n=1 Tax=Parastrongyloides trichosuri TaxID=131310 RepID=A0A0N4ZWJ5_PARTI
RRGRAVQRIREDHRPVQPDPRGGRGRHSGHGGVRRLLRLCGLGAARAAARASDHLLRGGGRDDDRHRPLGAERGAAGRLRPVDRGGADGGRQRGGGAAALCGADLHRLHRHRPDLLSAGGHLRAGEPGPVRAGGGPGAGGGLLDPVVAGQPAGHGRAGGRRTGRQAGHGGPGPAAGGGGVPHHQPGRQSGRGHLLRPPVRAGAFGGPAVRRYADGGADLDRHGRPARSGQLLRLHRSDLHRDGRAAGAAAPVAGRRGRARHLPHPRQRHRRPGRGAHRSGRRGAGRLSAQPSIASNMASASSKVS